MCQSIKYNICCWHIVRTSYAWLKVPNKWGEVNQNTAELKESDPRFRGGGAWHNSGGTVKCIDWHKTVIVMFKFVKPQDVNSKVNLCLTVQTKVQIDQRPESSCGYGNI